MNCLFILLLLFCCNNNGTDNRCDCNKYNSVSGGYDNGCSCGCKDDKCEDRRTEMSYKSNSSTWDDCGCDNNSSVCFEGRPSYPNISRGDSCGCDD